LISYLSIQIANTGVSAKNEALVLFFTGFPTVLWISKETARLTYSDKPSSDMTHPQEAFGEQFISVLGTI